MPRSRKKGYFRAEAVERKVQAARMGKTKAPIRLMSRESTIIPDDVGLQFMVHNGKTYVPLAVDVKKIGKKFGEYVPTKRFGGHSGGATGDKKSKIKKK
jgi:small subunit ribosomal protein S19